ncbi:hypothetical protein CAOG_010055 [Capsaspora owczarzaki ATCC 30864]|uniref:Uncharacterized protein n=1 Tax=Capsaspora owczarzaki (strain ATCC 30864) TaxID=595528 RepID=A0A0D2X4X9_CAPO3|nr:hypothetical protein CAOG_010055 [Capsaspora owczarzaki ATCC 30864]
MRDCSSLYRMPSCEAFCSATSSSWRRLARNRAEAALFRSRLSRSSASSLGSTSRFRAEPLGSGVAIAVGGAAGCIPPKNAGSAGRIAGNPPAEVVALDVAAAVTACWAIMPWKYARYVVNAGLAVAAATMAANIGFAAILAAFGSAAATAAGRGGGGKNGKAAGAIGGTTGGKDVVAGIGARAGAGAAAAAATAAAAAAEERKGAEGTAVALGAATDRVWSTANGSTIEPRVVGNAFSKVVILSNCC